MSPCPGNLFTRPSRLSPHRHASLAFAVVSGKLTLLQTNGPALDRPLESNGAATEHHMPALAMMAHRGNGALQAASR